MTEKYAMCSIITFLLSGALSFGISDVFSSIFAKLYAINEGVPLETLSEDYGMGILLSVLFLFSFIVLFPIMYFLIRKQMIKITRHH